MRITSRLAYGSRRSSPSARSRGRADVPIPSVSTVSGGYRLGGRVSDSVVDSLVLDLLEWIGPTPRPLGEVLDAWRTSCPRLPVWEEANDRGFLVRLSEPGRGPVVSVSDTGSAYLRKCRPELGS